MSVTLSEVKRAARAHRAPLAGESAGYLVLAIADQVLQAPRLVHAADVQLTEDGALRVLSGRASSDEEAELSLRSALDQLLLVASSGSAALTRASRRTVPVGLSALVRELEAALIPVNRSAARRALSRLHRETARALESGNLPADEEVQVIVAPPVPAVVVLPPAPVVAAPPEAAVVIAPPEPPAPVAAPIIVELSAPNPEHEPVLDIDEDLETPARIVPVAPVVAESHLDGVVTALCDALPAPPQFIESDATSALAVQSVPPPVAELEPEFLLDFDVDFESSSDELARSDQAEATDSVDSSAAPTVMRAVAVEPVPVTLESDDDSDCETQAISLPIEARTKPEPVVLRKTLRPLLDLLPKPSEPEPPPETPTLGTLAAQLPVLAPEQIAEMSVAANLARELSVNAEPCSDATARMPEVQPLSPGVPMIESKKSDVNELLSAFQVAEPDVNPGLCRAIKQMAELDLTPAPFAALIR
jgi:hypothetical protein